MEPREQLEYPTPVQLVMFEARGGAVPGVWALAQNWDRNRPWNGAALFQSPKRASGYRFFAGLDSQSILGACIRRPRAGWYVEGQRDRTSVVEVEIPADCEPLATVDEQSFRAGRNLVVIGSELCQVRRWTLIGRTRRGERVYSGQDMLRALRGTGYAAREHPRKPCRFAWIDGGGCEFFPLDETLLDIGRWWKACPPGGFPWEAEPVRVDRPRLVARRWDRLRFAAMARLR